MDILPLFFLLYTRRNFAYRKTFPTEHTGIPRAGRTCF